MRVVLDANIWISAAISEGRRIVDAWLTDQPFELVICHRLLEEVRKVLTERPRLRKRIPLEAAELYIATLATTADIHPNPPPGPALTRDPDGDYVIHLARQHHAEAIVTGDADLLEWPDQNPPVVSPADFEERLNQS
jgi:putative PIN family toxin of toxin-antitoxin system